MNDVETAPARGRSVTATEAAQMIGAEKVAAVLQAWCDYFGPEEVPDLRLADDISSVWAQTPDGSITCVAFADVSGQVYWANDDGTIIYRY